MSWGIKVTILYCAFVVMILTLVFKSVSQNFSLVSEDYYEKEINYQSEIDKKKNSAALPERLAISYQQASKGVQFSFPKEMTSIEGSILFYRPTDSAKDIRFPIQLNAENVQHISTEKLDNGLWRVKVDWTSNGKEFLDETPLVLR